MKTGIDYLSSKAKRSLDVMGGISIGAAMLPVAAAVGVASSVDTRALNPFFLQERPGQNHNTFRALKFRTIAKSAMNENSYGTFDPRATKWGQMLRQTGLDEMPQICNVVMGSMSLVGARPMLEQDIDFLEFSAPHLFEEWHMYYQASRPGLTGPSQIYRHHFRDGKSRGIYRKSVELDLRYFDKASLATDLKVLAHTPIDMFQANVGVIEVQEESQAVPELSSDK